MIKRLLLILNVLIPLITFAQTTTGSWKVYSRYTNISKMEQTPDKVYFLSSNSLYSYDKNTQQTYSYSSLNKLNDNYIKDIYYNAEGKYIVITYPTGNIDLLYDNGNVVNVSLIKDAVFIFNPDINDVAFMDNNIYIATKYGLVVYDEQNHKVKFSGIYNKEISFVTCVGDYVIVDQNHTLYYLHKDGRFESFSNFTNIASGYYFNDIQGISGNKMLAYASNKNVNLFTFDFANNKRSISSIDATQSVTQLIKGKDNFYFVSSDSIVYSINSEGTKNAHSKLPKELYTQIKSIWDNPNDIWAGDSKGIANYNIESGNADVLKDKIKPTSFSVDIPFFITSDKKGKVYVSTHAESRYLGLSNWKASFINTIDGNKVEDITPYGLESYDTYTNSPVDYLPGHQLGDALQLVLDPEDEETYYVGTFWDGIYKIKNGKMLSHYYTYKNGNSFYKSNSSFIAIYGCRVIALAFDKDNNLWCVNEVNKGDACLHFLPAEARKKETTVVEDWIPIKLGSFVGSRDVRLVICKKSNMIFICDGTWNSPIVAYDTKGTYSDVSDDTYYLWDYFIDQDGKIYDPNRVSAICEDNEGHVWIGTTNGVIEITDPSKANDPSMTVKHLKTLNEAGTEYTGYLLDALHVTTIAADERNRKWLGTLNNGVYLVDEKGEKIIEHFTSDNSYYPGGISYSIYVHPITNSVFMSTQNGLVEYNASSSPSKEDYSYVYTYPNPIKPDYTGWITIKGLMDNSNVKVCDLSGNVIYSTRSKGGMVIWDGCDEKGQRVKAGVYLVYASQDEIAVDAVPVTKILVVD